MTVGRCNPQFASDPGSRPLPRHHLHACDARHRSQRLRRIAAGAPPARRRHQVTAFGRDARRVRASRRRAERPRSSRGDALSGRGWAEALSGAEVAYYLIHSMEAPGATVGLRRAASGCAHRTSPARRARRGGRADRLSRWPAPRVPRRANGVPLPPVTSGAVPPSRMCCSARVPDALALRASIVIGARSRCFRLLVRLVERMPVLTLPAWRDFRTQPIDSARRLEMLAAAAYAPERRAVAGHRRPGHPHLRGDA